MKITLLILSPDFQIYVTQGHGAQFYYVDVHKLQYVQGCNQEYFMAVEVLAKMGTI